MNNKKDFELFAKDRGVRIDRFSGYSSPMVIEEKTQFAATYDIFSRLLNDRIIFLGDHVDSELANAIQAQLLYLDFQSHDDISIYINSPGGSITDGLAIYDTMNLVKSNVNTICTGMAASMAAVLLSSGAKRYALPHSRIMIHQPVGGAIGQTSDILIEAKLMESMRTELFEILAKNSGKSIEQIATDADRDCWLTAKEALDYGLIDEIKNYE